MDDLRAYRDECNSVLSEVTQALSFLTELQSKYLNVSRKTNALHEACENLLEEQVSDTKEGIKNVHSYFFRFLMVYIVDVYSRRTSREPVAARVITMT